MKMKVENKKKVHEPKKIMKPLPTTLQFLHFQTDEQNV